MRQTRLQEGFELAFLFGLGLISIYVGLKGYFSFLPGPSGPLAPSLTLGVLGVIVGYLALERRSKLDKIEHDVIDIADRLSAFSGEPSLVLPDVKQTYAHLSRAISQAEHTVDILVWGIEQLPAQTAAQMTEFHRWIKRKVEVASRSDVIFREVVSFPPGQEGIDRLRSRERLLELPGYQLWCCDVSHENLPPVMQYVVVDGKELIVAFYRGAGESRAGEVHLVTSHPATVRLFRDYFEVVMRHAKAIKRANKPPDLPVLEHFRQSVQENAPSSHSDS